MGLKFSVIASEAKQSRNLGLLRLCPKYRLAMTDKVRLIRIASKDKNFSRFD